MVDKFGMMADTPHVIQNPLKGYALNLDDLENVEKFSDSGEQNTLYGLKLNENGIYERDKITSQIGFDLDSSRYPDKAISLVFKKGKWIPVSTKFNWHVDIQLISDKTITKGNDHILRKIMNSGTMLTSLLPKNNQSTIVTLRDGSYFIGSTSQTILEFECEFSEDKNDIDNPPGNYSYIIIEGMLLERFGFTEIITGLKLKNKTDAVRHFSILIIHLKNRFSWSLSHDIEVQRTRESISLRQVFIEKDKFLISRIRFTKNQSVNNEIVKHH